MPGRKVYWIGNHTGCPAWGAPVSKVHKAGLKLLDSMGWVKVPRDYTGREPVFAFTTRKGANYPANEPGLPTVRQLPHNCTACLDDKRRLAQCLTASGCQHLMPPSWDTLGAYHAWLMKHQSMQQEQPQRQEQQGDVVPQQERSLPKVKYAAAGAADASTNAGGVVGASSTAPHASSFNNSNHVAGTVMQTPLPGGSVFVKHRAGVKGQAVYVAHTLEDVQQLQQRLKRSSHDFIVQQEVHSMLIDGRKFVLRVHVLLSRPRQPQNNTHDRPRMPDCKEQQQMAAEEATLKVHHSLDVYVHEDVIVVQHAQAYVQGSRTAAVNISSKGRHHPAPVLLQHSLLAPDLRLQIWAQLKQLAAQCIGAVAGMLTPVVVHPGAALYHLFGFDCMVDASGKVMLLEVNSYPAIASGTMSSVDVGVYTRLTEDIIRLLVLPLTDGVEPNPGGFVRVYQR